ncbi:MAG: IclR family transcriptional regulator [Dehalococcoidia bacterium]
MAGLDVLRFLVRVQEPVGVSRVARELGLSPSTCFNLLKTLVHEDLVEFDIERKSYAVSFGLLSLAHGIFERDQFIKFLRPRLERIASSHRVTVTLWQRVGADRVVLVDRVDAVAAVRVHMTIGQRLPLLVGALGRCFAAFDGLPRDKVRRAFDAIRWDSPPDFESYWTDVALTRERGYAIDRDSFVRGITTVAAPLLSDKKVPIMAVSAIGFTGQFTDDSLLALARDLHDCVLDIPLRAVGS